MSLSTRLGPGRLRHLAGVIIFSMLGLLMVNKAYVQPQAIDRPKIVEGTLEGFELLKRNERISTVKISLKESKGRFVIYPKVFAAAFDLETFKLAAQEGAPVRLEVRAQGMPVIYALQIRGEEHLNKEATRAHLAGRLLFLRLAALLPWLVAVLCVFLVFKNDETPEATKP